MKEKTYIKCWRNDCSYNTKLYCTRINITITTRTECYDFEKNEIKTN